MINYSEWSDVVEISTGGQTGGGGSAPWPFGAFTLEYVEGNIWLYCAALSVGPINGFNRVEFYLSQDPTFNNAGGQKNLNVPCQTFNDFPGAGPYQTSFNGVDAGTVYFCRGRAVRDVID